MKQLWSGRYDEAVALIAAKNGKLLVSREEWPTKCTNSRYTPPIECLGCGDTVTSTTLHALQAGQGFGCVGCKNKTEGVLLRWLQARYPDVQTQQPRFKRKSTTGTLRFDFSLPTERWIVELDGNISGGHFDDTPGNDTPVRDLEKEEWARPKGWQVIRVLQEDVWHGKNGWDNFLSTELAHWKTRRDAGEGPRRAITPQAPEYLVGGAAKGMSQGPMASGRIRGGASRTQGRRMARARCSVLAPSSTPDRLGLVGRSSSPSYQGRVHPAPREATFGNRRLSRRAAASVR